MALFAVTAWGAATAYRFADAVVVVAVLAGVVGWWRGVVAPAARVVVAASLWLVVSSAAAAELRQIDAAPLGPWRGVATLRTDPDRWGAGVTVVLEIEGRRYEARAWGAPARAIERRLAGEQLVVVGERRAGDDRRRSMAVARHIVGRFDVDLVAGAGVGSAVTRAANRVHRAVGVVAQRWQADHRALLSGLVLGNDAALSAPAVQAFRTSGLSHLTAVSGQNVALLLMIAAPLLTRTGRWWRWVLTVAVVAWFAVLTRFEPSVLRASAMALLGVSASVLGRDRRPVRLLALAGIALVLVDPLLVRSVSFWLSMSATGGLLVATPALLRLVDGWAAGRSSATRAVQAAWVTTAGAQVGVLGVSTVVFGLPSSVSLITNLLAVPPAGLVMMSGPALAVMGAAAPEWAPWCAAPLEWLVGWIAGVAHLGQRMAPPRAVDVVVWSVVIGVTVWGAGRRLAGR